MHWIVEYKVTPAELALFQKIYDKQSPDYDFWTQVNVSNQFFAAVKAETVSQPKFEKPDTVKIVFDTFSNIDMSYIEKNKIITVGDREVEMEYISHEAMPFNPYC